MKAAKRRRLRAAVKRLPRPEPLPRVVVVSLADIIDAVERLDAVRRGWAR